MTPAADGAGGIPLAALMDGVTDLDVTGSPELRIQRIRTDSRQVAPGDLFVAIAGRTADGHRFIRQAVAAGAVAVVHRHGGPVAGAVDIRTPHPRRTLAQMAHRFYGRPADRLALVGITGTNGKTTTALLVDGVMRAADATPALLGTIEYRYGDVRRPAALTTPGPLELHAFLAEAVAAGATHAVMEVSSHALDQHRVEGLEFQIGILTNVSHDHLDYHRDFAAYVQTKTRLFSQVRSSDGRTLLNGDDREVDSFRAASAAPCWTYGLAASADVHPTRTAVSAQGIQADVQLPGGPLTITSALSGEFNLYNILAAAACGRALGYDDTVIARGIESVPTVPGRFERVAGPRPFSVIVDYAHTPDAMTRALQAARAMCAGRVVVMFGCGGDRDAAKRPRMGAIAEQMANQVFLTSDNPRGEDPERILADIAAGMQAPQAARRLPDRAAAIEAAIDAAGAGDLVLLLGKGHERHQIIGTQRLPFDDRQVARDLLHARGIDTSQAPDTESR